MLVLVSDRVNVYVNLIAGLVSGLLLAGAAVLEVLGRHVDGHVLMGALAAAVAFLIAGLALVELRQRATTTATRGIRTGSTSRGHRLIRPPVLATSAACDGPQRRRSGGRRRADNGT